MGGIGLFTEENALEGSAKGQTRGAKKAVDPPAGRFAPFQNGIAEKGHRQASTPPPGPDGSVLGKAFDEPTGLSPCTEFFLPVQTPSND